MLESFTCSNTSYCRVLLDSHVCGYQLSSNLFGLPIQLPPHHQQKLFLDIRLAAHQPQFILWFCLSLDQKCNENSSLIVYTVSHI